MRFGVERAKPTHTQGKELRLLHSQALLVISLYRSLRKENNAFLFSRAYYRLSEEERIRE